MYIKNSVGSYVYQLYFSITTARHTYDCVGGTLLAFTCVVQAYQEFFALMRSDRFNSRRYILHAAILLEIHIFMLAWLLRKETHQ